MFFKILNYKIIFLHVPLAWYSMSLYVCLALLSLAFLMYKHPLCLLGIKNISYIGLILTLLTLITGSFWGMPMWGTFWVWDARMTSVLILFFLFLINYILNLNINNIKQMESAAFLALFGLINIPIIKYSVVWWNTLHQPASITSFKTTIHISILLPIFTTTIFIGFWILVLFIYGLRFDILTNKISLLEKKL